MPVGYRCGIATFTIFRGSRRGAALRARRETTSRGVKVSAAGQVFLEDARRILQQVDEATRRAKRVASGQSGTLLVGFVESISWHGVVPDSLRQFRERQPDAELQLKPLSSLEQIEAVRSGQL